MAVIGIAPLTAPELAPPELVSVAGRVGYSHVGVRLVPGSPGSFAWPLFEEPAMLRETLARMNDTGVGVLDIDIIRLQPGTAVASFASFFEVGARLGARASLVAGDDPDLGRLQANFAALCDLAAPFAISVDLEFMPWSAVPDLAAALRVLGAVRRPNAGVVVDPLHVDRGGVATEELRRIPHEYLHYMQLCDGPAERPATTEALIHAARCERLFPGEGDLDLPGMLRALPEDLPVSVEVPTETLARSVPVQERAQRALMTTVRVLNAVTHRQGDLGPS